MKDVIAWLAFVGAWLLFAGPIYQASIELGEQELERERIAATQASVAKPPRPSAWWWVIPILGYLVGRSRTRDYRHAVLAALDPVDRANLMRFLNKARGWWLVGLGGLLLATAETGQLCEHYDWPSYLIWVLVVIMGVLSAVYTALNVEHNRKIAEAEPR